MASHVFVEMLSHLVLFAKTLVMVHSEGYA